jgi:hypothetical protein
VLVFVGKRVIKEVITRMGLDGDHCGMKLESGSLSVRGSEL